MRGRVTAKLTVRMGAEPGVTGQQDARCSAEPTSFSMARLVIGDFCDASRGSPQRDRGSG